MANLAEGAGFEPAIRFPVYTLSRRAPSTARPPLHVRLEPRASRIARLSLGRKAKEQPPEQPFRDRLAVERRAHCRRQDVRCRWRTSLFNFPGALGDYCSQSTWTIETVLCVVPFVGCRRPSWHRHVFISRTPRFDGFIAVPRSPVQETRDKPDPCR